jgi:hypothetical protein
MEVVPINPIPRASAATAPAPASRFVLDFDVDLDENDSIVGALGVGGFLEWVRVV